MKNIHGNNEKADFNEHKYSDYFIGDPDNERIAEILRLVGNSKEVLDVGCGKGELGSLLIKQGNKVWGIDISKTCVEKANNAGLTAQILDVDIEEIPFEKKFDVVIAGEIIEHVEDTNKFLQKLRNKLKDRGELIVTTPNLAALGRRVLLMAGKNPHVEVSREPYSAGHLTYFVKDTLFWLLSKNGFAVIDFVSDRVNLDNQGKISIKWLAKTFPTLGKTLIIKCRKIN